MMMKRKLVFTLAALCIVSLAAWQLIEPAPLGPAPDVSFKTITNRDIGLRNLQGRPVIVTFWATDCPPCIEEIPHWVELYRQFHPRGLELIAVAMYYDPPSHVVEMSKIKQLPYPVALDLKAEHSKAFGGVMLTPTTFLISPQGDIVLKKLGLFDPKTLGKKIEQMLTPKNRRTQMPIVS